MVARAESIFQAHIRTVSGLWSDRLETASFGADPGRPDVDFYLDCALLPIEFKIGAKRADGKLIATIRPSQRIWFRRAVKFGIPCGVAIGSPKSKTFWLVRSDQVELLYLNLLDSDKVKSVPIEEYYIVQAFRELKNGENESTSKNCSDSTKFSFTKKRA